MLLRSDASARVPFALVAVLIVLLANGSTLYVLHAARQEATALAEGRIVRGMEGVAGLTHREVELEAHYLAMEAIRKGTKPFANASRINDAFVAAFGAYVADRFPRTVKGYVVDIEGYAGVVWLQGKEVEDFVPSNAVRTASVNETTVDVPDVTAGGAWRTTTRLADYVLLGYANYSVAREGLVLERRFPFARDLGAALPLAEASFEQLVANAQGENGEIGRIVRYVLGTLAQFRVLQGYAAGQYGEPGTSVGDVLTVRDVEMAVNLALLLEEVRRFRTFDARTVAAFDDAFAAPDGPGERRLARLFDTYTATGLLDPADLIALFDGLDEGVVPLNRVLAQAIAALVDQYVLRYLDYFGLASLADLALELVETLARTVEAFLEWVTDTSREEALAVAFVRDLFADLGASTRFLDDVALDLSDRVYVVSNASGEEVDITIAGHTALVDFDPVDILVDRRTIWETYYATVFASDFVAVHGSVRSFANDLARRVADDVTLMGAVPNPSLADRIDPRDNRSLLGLVEDEMTAAMDAAMENLRTNPEYLRDLLGNLWERQVEMTANLTQFLKEFHSALVGAGGQIETAKGRLVDALMERSRDDPDYASLDDSALADLRRQIEDDVNASGWVLGAFGIAARRDKDGLDALYEKAANLTTPPEEGGIFQRLQATVLDGAGLLARAGDLLKSFAVELVRGDAVANTVYRVPVSIEPFALRSVGEEGSPVRPTTFRVEQTPALLRATAAPPGPWDAADVPVGGLWVRLVDPTVPPPDAASPNVHYTRPDNATQRPFETEWRVDIAATVRLTVSSEGRAVLGEGTHLPFVVEGSLPVRLSLRIRVYSGWPLEGVTYAASASFGEDVWNALLSFLDRAWEALTQVLGWILDGLQKAWEILTNVLGTVLGYANEVIEVLSRALAFVAEVLKDLSEGAINLLGWLLDFLAVLGPTEFVVPAFGMTVAVALNEGNGTRVRAGVTGETFGMTARFVVLNETDPAPPGRNGTAAQYDVLAEGWIVADAFRFDARFDPLRVFRPYVVEGHGVWDDAWALDVYAPVAEAYVERRWAYEVPSIPTPLGTLDIEAGVAVRLVEEVETIDLLGLLRQSFEEAAELLADVPLDFDYVGRFVQTLIERFIENVVEAIEANLRRIVDVVLYIEGTFRAGGAAGGGVRLAFGVEGEAVLDAFRWIRQAIPAYLESLLRPQANVAYYALPTGIPERLFVRGEVFFTAGMPKLLQRVAGDAAFRDAKIVVAVRVNVAALAGLFGMDWGPWRADFGVYVERVPSAIADPLFGTGDAEPDVWLLRGTLYAVA